MADVIRGGTSTPAPIRSAAGEGDPFFTRVLEYFESRNRQESEMERCLQVRTTLNGDTDRAYGGYVVDLAQRLFGARVTVGEPKGEKVLCLTMTGTNLVEFLVSKGLHRGNKVKQQVDIPKWILSNDGV